MFRAREMFRTVLVKKGDLPFYFLDPRAKIIWSGVMFLLGLLLTSLVSISALFIYVCALAFTARIFKKFFSMLKVILPLFVFVVIVNMFFYPAEMWGTHQPTVIFEFPFKYPHYYLFPRLFRFLMPQVYQWEPRNVALTVEGIYMALYRGMKLLTLSSAAALFILLIEPYELMEGMILLKIPYKLAFAVSLTISYIPTTIMDFEMIAESQISRGYRLDQGGFIQKIRNYIPLVLPAVICSIKRARRMADSMNTRCFGITKQRTMSVERRFTRLTWIFLFKTLTVLGIGFYLIWLQFIGMTWETALWTWA